MPMAYYPAMQESDLATMHIEVRTHGDAMSMLPAMRKSHRGDVPDCGARTADDAASAI